MKAAFLALLLAQATPQDYGKNFVTPPGVPVYFTNQTVSETARVVDPPDRDEPVVVQAPVLQVPKGPSDVPLTPQQMQQPYQAPLQGLPAPQNLQDWPKSCQRLHHESNKCENGLKSCDQRLVERLRKRCARDEPHGE